MTSEIIQICVRREDRAKPQAIDPSGKQLSMVQDQRAVCDDLWMGRMRGRVGFGRFCGDSKEDDIRLKDAAEEKRRRRLKITITMG